MTAKRFMVDDAGTLIDIETRDTFDYVSDVVTLLNDLHEEKEYWKQRANERFERIRELEETQEEA